jgi:hypothetical protein
VVSSTPRPHFTPGKDPVPIVQEAGWAPGPVWTCAENLAPTRIRSPDRPARSQSLYRLSYPAHLEDGIFPIYRTQLRSSHMYGRSIVINNLQVYLQWVVYIAVNNYMFRPLYRPSSGCSLSCFKVKLYNIQCAYYFYFIQNQLMHFF